MICRARFPLVPKEMPASPFGVSTASREYGFTVCVGTAISAATASGLLINKKTLCSRLNISQRSLENMINRERFPRGVTVGKCVYWSEKALAAWLQREFGAQENWRP